VNRPACPSCHARVTPLTLECPVCGLSLPRRPLPRPLLFQASALRSPTQPHRGGADVQGISAPALGRIEPMPILDPPAPEPEVPALAAPSEAPALASAEADTVDSFWPVVRMEGAELCALLALNAVIAMAACIASGAWPSRLYGELWAYLLPLHITLSWAWIMVPLVLVGQSPMMSLLHLVVDADQPERRMAFSLLHLLSATSFPVSFLCMVLTPDHRTLAELLSGSEILQMPFYRVR